MGTLRYQNDHPAQLNFKKKPLKSVVSYIGIAMLITMACQANATLEFTPLERACQVASTLKQLRTTAQYEALDEEEISHTQWLTRTDSALLNQYGDSITQEILFSKQHGFTTGSLSFLHGLLNDYLALCAGLQGKPQ